LYKPVKNDSFIYCFCRFFAGFIWCGDMGACSFPSHVEMTSVLLAGFCEIGSSFALSPMAVGLRALHPLL